MNNIQIALIPEKTSKAELARLLNIDRSNLYKFHDLAMYVTDFAYDYPLNIHEEIVTSGRLSQYQCWVIYQVIQIRKQCHYSLLFEIPGLRLRKQVLNFLSRPRFEILKTTDNFEKESQQESDYLSGRWLENYQR